MSDQRLPDDSLARLIHAAGHREAPPTHAYERALLASTQVWQAKVRRRRWRLWSSLAAGLAVIAIATSLILQSRLTHAPSDVAIGQAARVMGAVRMRAAGAREWIFLSENMPIPSGATVRAERASGVALQVGDTSVRLAGGGEITVESPQRLQLQDGAVYVDAGKTEGSHILVMSRFGSVADIGTQFEVQQQADRLRVRIREGAVILQRKERAHRGEVGQELVVDGDGALQVRSIAQYDPAWRWAQALASPPEVNDQPLTVLLAWVARETGNAIRYASPTIEQRAATIILHGSIRHLDPLEALSVMLATTDLRHEVRSDGVIMIK